MEEIQSSLEELNFWKNDLEVNIKVVYEIELLIFVYNKFFDTNIDLRKKESNGKILEWYLLGGEA